MVLRGGGGHGMRTGDWTSTLAAVAACAIWGARCRWCASSRRPAASWTARPRTARKYVYTCRVTCHGCPCCADLTFRYVEPESLVNALGMVGKSMYIHVLSSTGTVLVDGSLRGEHSPVTVPSKTLHKSKVYCAPCSNGRVPL